MPRPLIQWWWGKGEGSPKNVVAAETSPSPQPSPRSCLAGEREHSSLLMVAVPRCAPQEAETLASLLLGGFALRFPPNGYGLKCCHEN